ncbi:MAG: DUF4215 domain-containing protein [Candidatus Peribacteraceae bacterium]|nr:DUF4215 domain-containing protein [Candidatus Peribacteraceae bacterium]
MPFRSIRFRRFLPLLALVAAGVFVGNFVSSGEYWFAQVKPPEECGNGKLDPWEDCEEDVEFFMNPCPDGQLCDLSTCRCPTPSVCGNDVVETNEQCDDGNMIDGDGCSTACTIESGWICAGQLSICQLRNSSSSSSSQICAEDGQSVYKSTSFGPVICCNGNAGVMPNTALCGDGCCTHNSLIMGTCIDGWSQTCGNGTCGSGEDLCNCQGDCATHCGNGIAETDEACGEPGLACPVGKTCQKCQCLGGAASSSAFSNSSAGLSWEECASDYLCTAKLFGNECLSFAFDCAPPSSLHCPSVCGNTSCSGECCRCVGGTASSSVSSIPIAVFSSSAFSSSSIAISSLCANGVIEPGEQCEIGYSCPTGSICTANCTCTGGLSSSSSSSQASGISAASSSLQQSSGASSGASSSTSSPHFSSSNSSSYSYSYYSSSSSVTKYALCGNGLQEGSEKCEVGIPCLTGQYCSNCVCMTANYCGDQVVNIENGEECESDNDCSEEEFCTLNCLCHEATNGNCGNGTMEALEQCEGNHPCENGWQCQACVCVEVPRCGNNVLERGEQCELTSPCPAGSVCTNCLCQQGGSCGNGVLGAGEQCEQDGDCASDQYCDRLTCQCEGTSVVSCGDGILSGQEQCELGQPCQSVDGSCDLKNCSCVLDLVTSLCGNAQVDAGEDCEIGSPCGDGEICNFASCHCIPWEQRCGDAELNTGEECEIGSSCTDATKVCDLSQCTCSAPSSDAVCGNGRYEAGEECEVGMACPFGWSCDYPHCRCLDQSVCGDAVRSLGEQCEVNSPCSGSDQTCDFSRCRCVGNNRNCGNTILDPGEQCDDGNKTDGDGCSLICQREWQTIVGGEETCGNGIVESSEECEDGNRTDGDGCSHLCRWEGMAGAPRLENAEGTMESGHAAGQTSRGDVTSSGTQVPGGTQAQGSDFQSQTIVFPGQQQPFFPSYYGSAVSSIPAGGPAGSTGPAAVAVIAAGAAAGWAWTRRRRKK